MYLWIIGIIALTSGVLVGVLEATLLRKSFLLRLLLFIGVNLILQGVFAYTDGQRWLILILVLLGSFLGPHPFWVTGRLRSVKKEDLKDQADSK